MSRLPALGMMLVLLASCEGLGSSTRKQTDGICNSDRDCLYGLVCRGTPVGVAGERRCIHERYARCQATPDCYPGRVCRENYCEVQCVVDTDCVAAATDGGSVSLDSDGGVRVASEDLKCVVGECRSGEPQRQCLSANDCPPDQDCLASRCVARTGERCVNDFDCPNGQRCLGGVCR